MKPLVIDLFCGLGGWADGFLAEGWDVIGFDIVQRPYPGQLVLQDALTITGAQLARLPNLAAIVASPPCTEYSYMAMPWSRGKQIAAALREQVPFPEGYTGSRSTEALNALFHACFRIQREASQAAGREIPIVVENVKGAQPWVGRSRANFGSFYLWGDVDSIGGRIVRRGPLQFGMPTTHSSRGQKKGRSNFHFFEQTGLPSPSFHGAEHESSVQRHEAIKNGKKVPGISWSGSDKPGYVAKGFNVTAAQRSRDESENGQKVPVYSDPRRNGGKGVHLTSPRENSGGVKVPLSGRAWFADGLGAVSSKSSGRKQATAEIAMIPPPLARYIAQVFKP